MPSIRSLNVTNEGRVTVKLANGNVCTFDAAALAAARTDAEVEAFVVGLSGTYFLNGDLVHLHLFSRVPFHVKILVCNVSYTPPENWWETP